MYALGQDVLHGNDASKKEREMSREKKEGLNVSQESRFSTVGKIRQGDIYHRA